MGTIQIGTRHALHTEATEHAVRFHQVPDLCKPLQLPEGNAEAMHAHIREHIEPQVTWTYQNADPVQPR